MTGYNSTSTTADDRIVEKKWRRILTEHGLSEGAADLVVKSVFSAHEISRASPTADDIREIVKRRLADSEFDDQLAEPHHADDVREQLLDALDNALNGQIGGPVSAPRRIAQSGLANSDDTKSITPVKKPNASATRAEPAAGRGAVDPDIENQFEVHVPDSLAELTDSEQELVEYLRDVVEQNSLDRTELLTAAAFVETHDGNKQT